MSAVPKSHKHDNAAKHFSNGMARCKDLVITNARLTSVHPVRSDKQLLRKAFGVENNIPICFEWNTRDSINDTDVYRNGEINEEDYIDNFLLPLFIYWK